METMEIVKRIDVKQIKSDIKAIAEEQKFLRNQRKTVHIVGERKISASDAEAQHRSNRERLREMYAAYGLMRGKKFSEIENHYPEEGHPLNLIKYRIDKLVEQYTKMVK